MTYSFESCLKKQETLLQLFQSCVTQEERYHLIIEMGRKGNSLDPLYKTEENLVKGCQSQTYIRSYLVGDLLYFEGDSDALISKGLVEILLFVYSGEKPEVILKCPPDYLKKLHLDTLLSPNRSSGLYNIHLRMKQNALQSLLKISNTLAD